MSPTFQPVRPSVLKRLIVGPSVAAARPPAWPPGIAAPAATAADVWKNVLRVTLVIVCPLAERGDNRR